MFSSVSLFVPTACGAVTMILCAQPYMHTHSIHIHALLKSCALSPTSITWSERQCDLAVQTLAPEPGSPVSHSGEAGSEDAQ